jgi:hypothetical protein
MPHLIRKIEANIIETFSSEVDTLKISGIIGEEDYFKVYSIEGFVQNFTKVLETEQYSVVGNFGLKINNKETFIEIEISY